jgi:hypothetical protein
MAGGLAASASPVATGHAQAGPKPTIVLEHGAWATSDSWDGVVRLLQRDGYTVDVPPNPLQAIFATCARSPKHQAASRSISPRTSRCAAPP